MRIRLIIEYDGTRYVGWQTQPNGSSIQETLERELKLITGESVSLHASGRTDSGVHALAQVAHFDTRSRIPADKFAYALNAGLPSDIRIRYSGEAPDNFHSRFDILRKHYRYAVQPGPHSRVFTRCTSLHVHGTLDFRLMAEAARIVLGTHDFAAFMASGSTRENTVRTIYSSEWTQDSGMLYYEVAGNGFLYNMVRILVGTMLDIGKGTLPIDCMETALITLKRDDLGATAPAHGLTLMRAVYPGFDTEEIIFQPTAEEQD